jgi:hypothetical protein
MLKNAIRCRYDRHFINLRSCRASRKGVRLMTDESRNELDKREMDLQLTKELEETFPASDPLTITRFPRKRHSAERELRGRKSLKAVGTNDAARFDGSRPRVSRSVSKDAVK